MMRLPEFRYRAPRTIADAAQWLAEDPAHSMLIAGGTDLLPNMKRRQQTPSTVIGLRGIGEPTSARCATCRGQGVLDRGFYEDAARDLIDECPDC